MIVEVGPFLSSIGGSIDPDHYLRPIPGRPGFSAYCRKPRYNGQKKKAMAKSDNAVKFKEINLEARRQYNDPVLGPIWKKKYKEALRSASKRGNPVGSNGKLKVPARRWDFVKQQVALQMRQSESH